jgi:hypothetical protein
VGQSFFPNERGAVVLARGGGFESHRRQLGQIQGRQEIGVHDEVVVSLSGLEPGSELKDGLTRSWDLVLDWIDEIEQVSILGMQTLGFHSPDVRFVSVVVLERAIFMMSWDSELIDGHIVPREHVVLEAINQNRMNKGRVEVKGVGD